MKPVPGIQVAVEHAIGELMFGCNLLSFSVTDEEAAKGDLAGFLPELTRAAWQVERAKRELKATLVNGSGSTRDSCNQVGSGSESSLFFNLRDCLKKQVGKEVLAYGRGVPPAEMMCSPACLT